jgi:hypothetical protein
MERPHPSVLMIRVGGPGSKRVDEDGLALLHEISGSHSGTLHVFADVTQMTQLLPDAKKGILKWGADNRESLAIHLLASSRILEMVFQVMALAARVQLKVLANRTDFDAAYRAACLNARTLGSAIEMPRPNAK